MAAAPIDIDCDAGSTLRFGPVKFTHPLVDANGELVLDANGQPQPGEPYDWTGCTARAQVRAKKDSPTVLVELTSDAGIVLGSGTDAGGVTLVLTAAQTDLIGWDPAGGTSGRFRTKAYYDIEVTYPSGDVERIMQGQLNLDPSVTRENA